MCQLREGFVELNRRFRKLDVEARSEEAALESYTFESFSFERGLEWKDLLQHYRVVILGEPGSGKTWEVEQQAAILKQQGHIAFHIRLDQLATQPLNAILSKEDLLSFNRWLSGNDEASFFLDSVDEAKFQKVSDFHAALHKVAIAIGPGALGRCRILITSRISEWQPRVDAQQLSLELPCPHHVRGAKDVSETHADRETLLVVHLQPLNRVQVQALVTAQGVTNTASFIEALDKAYAWEFTGRPLDVMDLAAFWKERGRIGNLTELVSFDIESKLRARTERADFPLTPAEAREGATWLAAASAFCHRFTFRVPEDHVTNTDALDTPACAPAAWSDEKLRALCNRPLFDGASYGSFRFHHRRVAEYLAAEWLAERMRQGCPEYELQGLLFDEVRGRQILRPSLAPLAAWLCGGNERWNQSVRAWVLQSAPQLHLKYGDPSRLSIEYRRQVLAELARASKDRRRLWLSTSLDSLARLGDPALSADVAAMLKDKTLATDIRIQMIEVVRHSRLQNCSEALLVVLADPTDQEDLHLYAAAAIGTLRDPRTSAQMARMAECRETIPNRLCAEIIEALYPDTIGGAQVAALLTKTGPVKKHGTDLPSLLERHFEGSVTQHNAGDLLANLIALLQTQPYATVHKVTVPISARFHWVGQLLPGILVTLLEKPSLTPGESNAAARALFLLGYVRQCRELYNKDFKGLNTATTRHPALRRQYFWLLAQDSKAQRGQEPTNMLAVFDYWEVLSAAPEDLDWLLSDIDSRPSAADKELALRIALELWFRAGRRRTTLREIRRKAQPDPDLNRVYRAFIASTHLLPLRILWHRQVKYKLAEPLWWRLWLQKLVWHYQKLRDQLVLLWHLRYLASGEPAGWLAELATEATESDAHHLAPSSWLGLEKKRGKWIALAARHGCKTFWRRFTPELPHEDQQPGRIPNGVIAGLAGLQAAIEDGDIDIPRLTSDDARLAVRYAVNEINGFAPWLYQLASTHSEIVREVLSTCLRGEWAYAENRQDVHDVLHHLVWNGEGILPLIVPTIIDLLKMGDPPNLFILRYALSILMHAPELPARELAELAEQRTSTKADPTKTALWFAIWLQLDASAAISNLEEKLKVSSNPDALVIRICAHLHNDRGDRAPLLKNPDYRRPEASGRFIPLVYRHVRIQEDIDRTGTTYTPGPRDDAQRFRGTLLDILANSEEPGATDALRRLVDDPALLSFRDLVLHLIDNRLQRETDLSPWAPSDLQMFATANEVDPKNDKDLFTIAYKRIRDLKMDVEASANSKRDELHPPKKELHFRRWLARNLNERSRNRYSVPQEPEIDLQQRPDLQFLRPGIGPVPVEAKLADMGWTVANLLERLENQLVGQYLRDHKAQYGIYVIGCIGEKQYWEHPKTRQHLPFTAVVDILSERAKEIAATNAHVADLAVIGIDFREPSRQH